jgi:hypothetical protein
MKRTRQNKLEAMSDEQLIALFTQLGIEKSKAWQTRVFNQLSDEGGRVWNVLKSRGVDSARKLLALLSHENPSLRFSAAALCYDFAREQCQPVLGKLTALKGKPEISFRATFFLYRHDPEFQKKFGEEMDRLYPPPKRDES